MTIKEQNEYIIENLTNLIVEFLKDPEHKELALANMAYDLVATSLNNVDFFRHRELDTNGWQVDYLTVYSNADEDILSIEGSMYYGNVTIHKGDIWNDK